MSEDMNTVAQCRRGAGNYQSTPEELTAKANAEKRYLEAEKQRKTLERRAAAMEGALRMNTTMRDADGLVKDAETILAFLDGGAQQQDA